MKNLFFLIASVGLVASANAQFSVSSGVGDLIPGLGSTGAPTGWDAANVDHDLTAAVTPGTATVTVPEAVSCIDAVELDGLTHTWSGDTLAILRDPNDVGYVIWIRPEIEVGETCCGNSGDFLPGGTFTFVEPGTSVNGELTETGSYAPGIWDQTLSSNDSVSPVVWPSPDEMIFNTPLSGISGPAGDWTISIYDFAGGDTGSFDNFTLIGNSCGGGPVTFCDPQPVNCAGLSTNLAGSLAGSSLTLVGTDGPPGEFGYYVTSFGFSDPGVTISHGEFCLDIGAVGFERFNVGTPGTSLNSTGIFDALGHFDYGLTPGADFVVPAAMPSGATYAGMTAHFQLWHRDSCPAGESNFSNGLTITFP